MYVGILPFIINLVSAMFKASKQNWQSTEVKNIGEYYANPILYYFQENIIHYWIVFVIALVIIGYTIIVLWKKYLSNVNIKVSMITNVFRGLLKIVLGCAAVSGTLIISSLYNFTSAFTKVFIDKSLNKIRGKGNAENKPSKGLTERLQLYTGLMIIVASFAFLILEILNARAVDQVFYPLIIVIVLNVITFSEIIAAIMGFIKYKNNSNTELETFKYSNLATAIISTKLSQAALFSSQGIINPIVNLIFGIIAGGSSLAIGAILIVKSFNKRNNKNEAKG